MIDFLVSSIGSNPESRPESPPVAPGFCDSLTQILYQRDVSYCYYFVYVCACVRSRMYTRVVYGSLHGFTFIKKFQLETLIIVMIC